MRRLLERPRKRLIYRYCQYSGLMEFFRNVSLRFCNYSIFRIGILCCWFHLRGAAFPYVERVFLPLLWNFLRRVSM